MPSVDVVALLAVSSFSELLVSIAVGAGLAALAITDDGLLTSEADLRPANVEGISLFLKNAGVAVSSLFFSDVLVKDPNETVGLSLDLSLSSLGFSSADLAEGVLKENVGVMMVAAGLELVDFDESPSTSSLLSGELISVILAEEVGCPKPVKGEGVDFEGVPNEANGDGAADLSDFSSGALVPKDKVDALVVLVKGVLFNEPKPNPAEGFWVDAVSLVVSASLGSLKLVGLKLKGDADDDDSKGLGVVVDSLLVAGLPNENAGNADVDLFCSVVTLEVFREKAGVEV